MFDQEVSGAVARLMATDVGGADVAGVELTLSTVGRIRGWLDAVEAKRWLGPLSSQPTVVAQTGARV